MLWDQARQEVRTASLLNHSSILPISSCTHWQPSHQPVQQRPLYELINSFSSAEPYLLTLCQYTNANLSQFITYYEKPEAQQAVQERGLSLRAHIGKLIQQMGSALSAAHACNLVHGALTPGNILLDGRDRLWVADFGLARLHPPFAPYLAPELEGIVQRGSQVGDWRQFWQSVSPANDQYMLAQICQLLFTRLLQPGEYERTLPILRHASQSKPEQRFASIDSFLHELLNQLQGTGSRPAGRISSPNNTSSAAVASFAPSTGSNPAYPSLASSGSYGGYSSPSQARSITAGYHSSSSPYPVRNTTAGYHSLPTTTSNDAISQYGKMLNYSLAASQPTSPADEWEKRGGKLFTEHDFAGAVRAYRQALALDNYRSTLWQALGDAHFALEQYKEALSSYEQALSLNPNDSATWLNRGTVLDSLGRRQEAIECYERADQLDS
jgi:tetratricopeptide (TPR) repeat protein